MNIDRDEIICTCAGVTYGEIVDAIKNGADTLEKLQEATDAGNYCGFCISEEEDADGSKEYYLVDILKEIKGE